MNKGVISLVIIVSFALSQSWAFEGLSAFWSKKPEDTNQREIQRLSEEKKQVESRLKQVTPVYEILLDEVEHLLPNLIGAIDAKGAGDQLSNDDVKSLCAELRDKLLRPDLCMRYFLRQSRYDKEALFHFLEKSQGEFTQKRAEFQSLRRKASDLSKSIDNLKSLK